MNRVVAFAPGRVNLIGEHTDYTGGLAMPMAIHLGTSVSFTASDSTEIVLTSEREGSPALVAVDVDDPASLEPRWARYVAGVVAEIRPARGGTGAVSTTLPVGAGLSSSAALEVAIALALGFDGSPHELAHACQRAEQRASGVPCGLMDQLASAGGLAGHALLLDFETEHVTGVRLPDGLEVVAVHSGQERTLVGSAYAERRASCERAAELVGPLRCASLADVEAISDRTIRRRAHHIVTENHRVLAMVAAFAADDAALAGEILDEGHRSLRDDFEVSTPVVDALVARLRATPGVHGARLTGAGFGGCAVALCEPGALDIGWTLRAVHGASVIDS